MKANNELSAQQAHSAAGEQMTNEVRDDYTPRKLTFAENAVLTVKVLVVAGLILAVIWGLKVWVTPD
jgi:hypothetical protein